MKTLTPAEAECLKRQLEALKARTGALPPDIAQLAEELEDIGNRFIDLSEWLVTVRLDSTRAHGEGVDRLDLGTL